MSERNIWICPKCSSSNPAESEECYVCGGERPPRDDRAAWPEQRRETERVSVIDAHPAPKPKTEPDYPKLSKEEKSEIYRRETERREAAKREEERKKREEELRRFRELDAEKHRVPERESTKTRPTDAELQSVWSWCFASFRAKLDSCRSGLKMLSWAGTLIGFGSAVLSFATYVISGVKIFSGFGFGMLTLILHFLTLWVYFWYEGVAADQQFYLFNFRQMMRFTYYEDFRRREQERQALLGEAAQAGAKEFRISLGKTYAPIAAAVLIHGFGALADTKGIMLVIFFSYIVLFVIVKGKESEGLLSAQVFREWRNYLWKAAREWEAKGYKMSWEVFCPLLYQKERSPEYDQGKVRILEAMAVGVFSSILLWAYGLLKSFGF